MECEIKRSDGVEVTDEQRRFGRNAITNAMNGGATALAYPEDWDASTDMKIGDMIEFNKKWKDCPNVWNFSQYGPAGGLNDWKDIILGGNPGINRSNPYDEVTEVCGEYFEDGKLHGIRWVESEDGLKFNLHWILSIDRMNGSRMYEFSARMKCPGTSIHGPQLVVTNTYKTWRMSSYSYYAYE